MTQRRIQVSATMTLMETSADAKARRYGVIPHPKTLAAQVAWAKGDKRRERIRLAGLNRNHLRQKDKEKR